MANTDSPTVVTVARAGPHFVQPVRNRVLHGETALVVTSGCMFNSENMVVRRKSISEGRYRKKTINARTGIALAYCASGLCQPAYVADPSENERKHGDILLDWKRWLLCNHGAFLHISTASVRLQRERESVLATWFP